MTCKHENFQARVHVDRLTDLGRWIANLQVRCRDCGAFFRFEGLDPGIDFQGAATDEEGTTARLSVIPHGELRLSRPGDDISVMKR